MRERASVCCVVLRLLGASILSRGPVLFDLARPGEIDSNPLPVREC
jgi:hypothetical protein